MDFKAPAMVSFHNFILLYMAAQFPGLHPVGVLPWWRAALQAGEFARALAQANSYGNSSSDEVDSAWPVCGAGGQ